MGCKYDELRQELDSLGYRQKLHPECIPLVQKLLADLNTTTTNLQKYMKISQHALEERDILELGAEPYKCDNAKLIKECNDLHIAFIHFKEQHEKIQRELRNQISTLQIRLENCNLEKSKIMSQLQQLEKEKFRKASRSGLPKEQKSGKENKNLEISTAMANADETISQLNREFKDLKDKHAKLAEDNCVLQNQLMTRDEEINRLQSLLQGGRPFKAVTKDCCYQNVDGQMGLLQDEVTRLKKEKSEFLMQVKEALAKQHEAMRRALHLAERNRQLEKEMRDIDEIALAVEAECNSTVKGNTEKVTRLQDRINESLILIQNLERDNAKLKQDKLKLSADLDAVKLEKLHIQKQLDQDTEDRKRLTDRINNFTIIENDLNLEIDRLTKLTAEQKRRIIELESQINGDKSKSARKDIYKDAEIDREESKMSDKILQTVSTNGKLKQKFDKKPAKIVKGKGSSKSSSPSKTDPTKNAEACQKCCCESGTCVKNLKELLDKEMEYRQAQAMQSIESLKQEKEYYMKEYHRALEQTRNVPTHERTDSTQSQVNKQELMEYKLQIKEKETVIKELETVINEMKSCLRSAEEFSVQTNICSNPNCKRKEREMDVKTNELNHLEMENNALKSKLQSLNETTVFNEERIKKAFKDMEEHIRKLEDERRDLVKAEVTQRSNISQLEEDYKMVKDQLRQTQNDLNNQKANYNQLKLLHEQTDRALADAQSKVIRAETELVNYQSIVKDSTRDTASYDREIAKLKSDVQIMRNQLTKLDKEKDELLNNLDEKTERIAVLEDELKSKNKAISRLEAELKDLKRKLSKYETDSSTQDHMVRSKQQELAILEQDYEKERKLKEAALFENRRLQDDMTAITCDCRDARNELEISRRQVEDLKRQLQHYVAEVKRTEDLISNKELERAELLDQFRCLSQEANMLESNNHTLETVATQSKVQLSVALDHTSDLERRLENQESIIKSYEKQISDLTAQVASFEIQLRQNNREQHQYSTEIKQMRDLCVKLDKDKDSLKHELYSKEDYRAQVEKATEKLESEKETLQRALEKERTSLKAVEKLLNEARQEVLEQRVLNQELQSEVSRLKQKIAQLQERLRQGDKLDSHQRSFELTSEHRSKRDKKDIVHFCNDTYNGPPYKDHSVASTKTLSSSKVNQYHGSDGVFHGVIDLTKLDDEPAPPSKIPSVHSTCTLEPTRKYHGSDNLFYGTIDLTKLDEGTSGLSRKVSDMSTKSLTSVGKYHGSDGGLNGNIELNKMEQKNAVEEAAVAMMQSKKDKLKETKARTSVVRGGTIDLTNLDTRVPYISRKILDMSTGSLTSAGKYYGSDGGLHGNIELNKREEKNAVEVVTVSMLKSKKDKLKKTKAWPSVVRGATIDLANLDQGTPNLSRRVSDVSTKSLTATRKYHGSDGILHGNLALNKMDEKNADEEAAVSMLKSENDRLKETKARPSENKKKFEKKSNNSDKQTISSYNGSYELFNQFREPAMALSSSDEFHASYEVYEARNLKGSFQRNEGDAVQNKHPAPSTETKNIELQSKKHLTELKETKKPSERKPNNAAAYVYHGSYDIFEQSQNPPVLPPPSEDYHASYEGFFEPTDLNYITNDPPDNGLETLDTTRTTEIQNLESHKEKRVGLTRNQNASFTGNCYSGCNRSKCINYVTIPETNEQDPSHKDRTNISTISTKKLEDSANQKNLSIGNKCLESTRQKQSVCDGVISNAHGLETRATASTSLYSKTASKNDHKMLDPSTRSNSPKEQTFEKARVPKASGSKSDNRKSSDLTTKSPSPKAQPSAVPQSSETPRKYLASKGYDNQKMSGQSSKQVSTSYDILWNKCKCQECLSNASVSEPNMRGQCLTEGLTATKKCHKKNTAEKIKDRVKEVPKSPSDKSDKSEVLDKSKTHGITNTNAGRKKYENYMYSCTRCHAHAEFSQNSDDSAEFRKVFSINGVGLQCLCSISTFKAQDKN